jgi:hypothetical protein
MIKLIKSATERKRESLSASFNRIVAKNKFLIVKKKLFDRPLHVLQNKIEKRSFRLHFDRRMGRACQLGRAELPYKPLNTKVYPILGRFALKKFPIAWCTVFDEKIRQILHNGVLPTLLACRRQTFIQT